MTPLIKHIASGQAFFSGVALIVLAVLMLRRSSRLRGSVVVAAAGMLLIGASATPLPNAFYVTGAALSLVWMVTVSLYRRQRTSDDLAPVGSTNADLWARRARLVTVPFLGVWLAGAAMELPYHVMPAVPKASAARLTIFADSVTAGIGEGEAITWPELLMRERPIEVVDHSRMGATARSATLLAEQHPPKAGIVFLEIGGNDVLGNTTTSEFARTLDDLLALVSGGDRQVVMLELPLPPMYQEYGRIQRRLAKQHDVALIPKRFLLEVLLSDSTTLDSIHLSQAGHRQMADQVWNLLRMCY
jgi:acyl-CoA thioesterase-1